VAIGGGCQRKSNWFNKGLLSGGGSMASWEVRESALAAVEGGRQSEGTIRKERRGKGGDKSKNNRRKKGDRSDVSYI